MDQNVAGWLTIFEPFCKCNLFTLPHCGCIKIQTIDGKEHNKAEPIFKKFNADSKQKLNKKDYLNLIISLFIFCIHLHILKYDKYSVVLTDTTIMYADNVNCLF